VNQANAWTIIFLIEKKPGKRQNKSPNRTGRRIAPTQREQNIPPLGSNYTRREWHDQYGSKRKKGDFCQKMRLASQERL